MRTNREILTEVYNILYFHPGLDATHISVKVDDGIVTLNGSVHSSIAKWMAKESIRHIHGIKKVNEKLDVIP